MANNTTRTPAPSVSPALSSASAQTPPLSPATAPASAPSPALSPASAPTPAPSPASAPVPALSSAPPQTAAVSPASIQTSALYLALSPSPTLSPASSPTAAFSLASSPTPAFSPASHPAPALSSASHPAPALSPASHPAPALSPASHPAPALSPASHPAPALSPASHPASGLSPASHPTSGLSPASTPYSVVYCKLCLSEQPLAATSKLHTCNCVFCTPCLQQYVQLAIRDGGGSPVTCPDMACEKVGALLDSEIACFVSAEQVELYQRLKFERGVQLDPGKAWCPVLECQAVCTVRPTTEGRPTSVPCLACQAVFCSGCRGPWESGHSCPELQPMTSFSSDGRAQSSSEADMPIKQCPICGVYIERNQGCAQMLCKSCKHTFCWYCLQSLDGDIFLRHYDKGPCKNKLGHSRASVMWNRTQVVGILVGVSVIVLVTSPLLLLASPCILGCMCKPCGGSRKRRGRKRTEHGQKDLNS